MGGPESKDVAGTLEHESLTPRAFKACTVSRSSELDSSALLWCASWITGIPRTLHDDRGHQGPAARFKSTVHSSATPITRTTGEPGEGIGRAIENFIDSQCGSSQSYCSLPWWLLWSAWRSITPARSWEAHIPTTVSSRIQGTLCTWCSYTETSAGRWQLLQPESTAQLFSSLTSS